MERIGKLDRRIKIVDPYGVPVQGDDGQPLPSAVEIDEVWANIEPVTADESRVASKLESESTHVIKIRYREDVILNGSRWQAVWRQRTFEGKGAIDVKGEQRFVEWYLMESFPR